MNQSERRNRIIEYLRIKPISHGQIYTFQLAVPESQIVEIPVERRENLRRSLTEQGSNLIPLIVRRTEDYSEEEEYEVVYGVDWCLVAKELDIEKLWVWVFDMTDEQAVAAKAEMEQLTVYSNSIAVQPSSDEGKESIEILLQKFNKPLYQLETFNRKIEQVATFGNRIEKLDNQQTNIQEKVESITHQVEQVTRCVTRIEDAVKKLLGNSISDDNKYKYDDMIMDELRALAKKRGIKGRSGMTKPKLIDALKKADADKS